MDNLISKFGRGWIKRISGCGENGVTDVSDSGEAAVLTLDGEKPMLQKYEYSTEISADAAYKISVKYELSGTKSKLAAYALASLYDKDGTLKRRLYFCRSAKNVLELAFKSENEVKLILELGLKQTGTVKWHRPVMTKTDDCGVRNVKIAAVHIAVEYGRSYKDNLAAIERAIDKAAAKGADILAFAETIADRGTGMADEKVFEPIDGPVCTFMRRKAAEHGVYIMFTYHEKDENGIRHNTALLVDRKGNIAGRYIKTHQALVEYERGMVPGGEYPVFDTDFGRIGMLICWDAYFPEPAKAMANKGAEILFVSTAGNPTYRHISRAKENGVYVVVACAAQDGDSGILPTKIITPSGEITAQTNVGGESAFVEIDLNKKDYIYWLSVGGANSIPREVYANECRDDLYGLV